MPRGVRLPALETVLTAYPNLRGDSADSRGDSNKPRLLHSRQLVALTNDPALVKALQELPVADQYVVHIVADLRALSDELLQHVSAIALIDAAALDAPIDGAVDAITTQFPDLKLMIAGQSAEQNALAQRIAAQTVFRFVHKPVSPQRLRLFLDAAARPAEPTRGMAQPVTMPSADSPSLARIDTAVRGKSPVTLAVIGLVVIAAIAAAAWLWLKDGRSAARPAEQPAEQAAATPAQPSSPEVMALIHKADQAFADGKYVGLDGNSAAELYRAALQREQRNPIARQGLDRSVDYGMRRAEDAVIAGRLNEAAVVAEALRMIEPGNPRLNFLNAQLEKEQARIAADASQQAALTARQTQIRGELDLMAARMQKGALLDPAGDSAVFHFRAAEALWPSDPMVRNSRDSLVAALLTAADNELSAHRQAPARRMVEAAATLNSAAPGLDILRRRLEEMSVQQASVPVPTPAAAEPAAPATAEPVKAEPAAAPAPAAATPAEVAARPAGAESNVVSATTLKLKRSVEPEFPQLALKQGISGWVEMEFTVAPDGGVKDVVVTGSEPGHTFDAAAATALRHYRYEPVVRDGTPVAQRARLRMRFTVQDAR